MAFRCGLKGMFSQPDQTQRKAMNDEAKESRFGPAGQQRTARRVLRVRTDLLRRTRAVDSVLSMDGSEPTDSPAPGTGRTGQRLCGDGDGTRGLGIADRGREPLASRGLL